MGKWVSRALLCLLHRYINDFARLINIRNKFGFYAKLAPGFSFRFC